MNEHLFYIPSGTPVMRALRCRLMSRGFRVSDAPCAQVTHLILETPCREPDGITAAALKQCPGAAIIGGGLTHPLLAGRSRIDLLQREDYLWTNAAITAQCAVTLAGEKLQSVWHDAEVLILGFGRIGKHLAATLKALDARVSIAARSERDRAAIQSFGMTAERFGCHRERYEVIFNTVPAPVLKEGCPKGLRIDLASVPGMAGDGVVWARGLPGSMAPESAADNMAHCILKALKEEMP